MDFASKKLLWWIIIKAKVIYMCKISCLYAICPDPVALYFSLYFIVSALISKYIGPELQEKKKIKKEIL